ncbi:hypothetical protein BKA62DRAFT_776861 [Auriculariales sp. MPI-PUGE-AT-0066]|nr:hypothetical protein BKA62DRAFT_776861 [Auriculariales sp. MPI-PUGE-AT-0066]
MPQQHLNDRAGNDDGFEAKTCSTRAGTGTKSISGPGDAGAAQRLVDESLPLPQPSPLFAARTPNDGPRALAVLVSRAMNVTVDDSAPELRWTGDWTVLSQRTARAARGRSWHFGTRETTAASSSAALEMAYTFNGTGVWLFGATVPKASLLPRFKQTRLAFTLDGVPQGGFELSPKEDAFEFDVLFFGSGDLEDGTHTLKVAAMPGSVVIVDRVVVATSDQSPATPSVTTLTSPTNQPTPTHKRGLSQSASVTLAVVIPIIVALFAVALIWLYLRRRWRREDEAARRVRADNHKPHRHRSVALPPPVVARGLGRGRGPAPAPAPAVAPGPPVSMHHSAHIASYHSGATGVLAAAQRFYGAMHSAWPFPPSSHEPSHVASDEPRPRRHRTSRSPRSPNSSGQWISVSRRVSRNVDDAAGAALTAPEDDLGEGPSNRRDSHPSAASRKSSRGPWPSRHRLSGVHSALPNVQESGEHRHGHGKAHSIATSASFPESVGRVLVAPPPAPPLALQKPRRSGSMSPEPPGSSRRPGALSDDSTPLTLLESPHGSSRRVTAGHTPSSPSSPPPVALSPHRTLGRRVSRPLPVPPGPYPPDEPPMTDGPVAGTKQ